MPDHQAIAHVIRNRYMIVALCKLNKDDFGNKIIMNRLFHLPVSKFIIPAMVLIYLTFECIFNETHTIVILYD